MKLLNTVRACCSSPGLSRLNGVRRLSVASDYDGTTQNELQRYYQIMEIIQIPVRISAIVTLGVMVRLLADGWRVFLPPCSPVGRLGRVRVTLLLF